MPSPLQRRPVLAAVAACLFEINSSGEMQLLPAGEFRGVDGRPAEVPAWRIDGASAAKVIERSTRANKLVIDYEHQTLNVEKNGQPAPAAGWFESAKLEWREGQGLFATGVDWTAQAKAMIDAQPPQYRYISPVFGYDKKTGEVLFILMAALTNNPNLDGMAEVALRAAARFSLTEDGDDEMNELMKAVLAALGLKEDATKEQAVSAVAALKADADKVPTLTQEVAAAKAKVTDPGKFVSIETHNATVTELAALKKANETRDVGEAVAAAVAEGRLPTGESDWAKSFAATHGLAALKESLGKRPVIAALRQTQTGGKPPAGGAGKEGELSEEQLAVCTRMGIKPEDFKKEIAAAA